MTNKTLEQAIIETSRRTVCRLTYDLQEADARERHFRMGAEFVLNNLHLLSPSDVAKIPAVNELLCQIDNALDEIAEYQYMSEHTHDLLIKACKVFEVSK